MKNALIIGASGGIGSALAENLAARGVAVTGLSRRGDEFDITDPESVARHLTALTGPFDLVFVASGQLVSTRERPEKSLREVSAEELAAQFAVNAIGPALVLRHAPRLLPRKGRSVFAVLSARVGSIGDNRAGGWYSYRASKAAVNQIVHSSAIELGRTHREAICVALHPGTVATAFTAEYPGHDKVAAPQAAANLVRVMDGLDPRDTGQFFDWAGKAVPW